MQRILIFGVIAALTLAARAGEVPPLKQRNVRQAAHVEHNAAARQYIVKLRICQGDPAGSVAKKTLKVLSEPAMIVTDYTPATLHVGGEVAVPGDDDQRLPHGVRVEIQPRGVDEGKIRASIAWEMTHGMQSANDDVVSAGGVCFRTSGLFMPGKMVKLSSPDSDTWIEVTLETIEPKAKPARR